MASPAAVNRFVIKVVYVELELHGPAALAAVAGLGLAVAGVGAFAVWKASQSKAFCKILLDVLKAVGKAIIRKLNAGSLVVSLVICDSADLGQLKKNCDSGKFLKQLNDALKEKFEEDIGEFDKVQIKSIEEKLLDIEKVSELNNEVENFNRQFLEDKVIRLFVETLMIVEMSYYVSFNTDRMLSFNTKRYYVKLLIKNVTL